MNRILEYKGYRAETYWDSDDRVFVGSVLDTHDSLNFHGTSIDELQKQFEICIDDYIEIKK